MMIESGHLRKMQVRHRDTVQYQLPLDDKLVPINDALGRTVSLRNRGEIHCQHCGRKTGKSFSQGFCYPCFRKLAQCDICIMSPEKCHYDQGTCREPEWAQSHCMVDHIVYLANSSGVKVGITRESQIPTRWIDQGAVQALPIMRVKTRQQSGLVEDVLREHVSDRTDWRAMLKGAGEEVDLTVLRDALLERCNDKLAVFEEKFGLQAFQRIDDAPVQGFNYPVLEYPDKIRSLNLDKSPVAEGILLGIKGQYLIFDTGVFNIRKYTSYLVDLAIH